MAAKGPARHSPWPDLAVIAALSVERRCLETRDWNAMILQSGPGPGPAASAARQAVDAGATALLSFGLAGSLDKRIAPGAVIVASHIIDPNRADDDSDYVSAGPWREAVLKQLDDNAPHEGAIVSVADVVSGPDAKAGLAARYGAIACDMESAAIARVAAESGSSFLAVRVIVDGADDPVPRRMASFVDSGGNSRIVPVLKEAFQPAEWKAIFTIVRRFAGARRVLADVARRLAPRAYAR